ncbi:Uncharacterised protein [Mycobacterium tuberculosis]|nr:Uncharacterised protein [Mycobacterium tuberculosis]
MKPLDTKVRIRRCAGSSMASIDITRYASEVREDGSRDTP